MSQNTRRLFPDSYDPKQRLIGGIVLFLIMMLIYSLLKLVLGFSPTPTGKFGLGAPLGDEITNHLAATENIEGRPNSHSRSPLRPAVILLPQSFVFLDIHGKPMQKESYQSVNNTELETKVEGKGWYIQVASFRDENQAQSLAEKIKEKQISSQVEILKSGAWYKVVLPSQSDRNAAEQQRKQLRNLLRINNAIIKKVEE